MDLASRGVRQPTAVGRSARPTWPFGPTVWELIPPTVPEMTNPRCGGTKSTPPDHDQLSRLVVRRRVKSAPAPLAWAIRAARAWLGREVEPAPPGMRRYQVDLRFSVREHPSIVTFGKAAYVDIGPVQFTGDDWEVEVSWRASTLAPLFPVFSGSIVALNQELTLSGWYAPPGGAVGRVADRALLHIAAQGTARWLLRELDDAAARGAV